jgi:hypothetical protein
MADRAHAALDEAASQVDAKPDRARELLETVLKYATDKALKKFLPSEAALLRGRVYEVMQDENGVALYDKALANYRKGLLKGKKKIAPVTQFTTPLHLAYINLLLNQKARTKVGKTLEVNKGLFEKLARRLAVMVKLVKEWKIDDPSLRASVYATAGRVKLELESLEEFAKKQKTFHDQGLKSLQEALALVPKSHPDRRQWLKLLGEKEKKED